MTLSDIYNIQTNFFWDRPTDIVVHREVTPPKMTGYFIDKGDWKIQP